MVNNAKAARLADLALAVQKRKLSITSEQKRIEVLMSQMTTSLGLRTRFRCLISIGTPWYLRLARMVAFGSSCPLLARFCRSAMRVRSAAARRFTRAAEVFLIRV